MKKVFDVFIHDKPYEVFDIPGKKHLGLNDTPKDWWIFYGEKLPEGLLPSIDSDEWVPYCSKSINRLCWELKFKENNTSKFKWDEWQFSSGCTVEMWCNGKHIYTFRCGSLDFAMAKAQYLMTVMLEHPYNFLDQESQNGRKVFFYGLPATIRTSSYPGEIKIVPDYSVIEADKWWQEYSRRRKCLGKTPDEWDEIENEDDQESKQGGYINWGDALSDGNINWFRD